MLVASRGRKNKVLSNLGKIRRRISDLQDRFLGNTRGGFEDAGRRNDREGRPKMRENVEARGSTVVGFC